MLATLNGKKTKGLNFIAHKNQGGTVEFEIDNHLMLYEIQSTKSSIKFDVKDRNTVDISIKICAKGSIGEMFGSKTLLTPKRFKKIEKPAYQTLNKAQHELNADIFGFAETLKQRHYDDWQKIKDDWDYGDNIFANCNINATAKAIVRSVGSTDKTKSR